MLHSSSYRYSNLQIGVCLNRIERKRSSVQQSPQVIHGAVQNIASLYPCYIKNQERYNLSGFHKGIVKISFAYNSQSGL